MNSLNKIICDEVKNKLKDDINSRYKILVHCIIGKYQLKNKVRDEDKV